MTNRCYIPAYGPDHNAVKAGLKWLLEGSNETLVLYVPTLRQVDTGTVLTTVLGESVAKQFRKTGVLRTESSEINLITALKMNHQPEPVRILALWADSDGLKKIESRYRNSNILVVTWNSKYDIEEWKRKHQPEQYSEYTPPPIPDDA